MAQRPNRPKAAAVPKIIPKVDHAQQIMEENEIALRTLSMARSAFLLHAQEMSNLRACVPLGATCGQNQQGPELLSHLAWPSVGPACYVQVSCPFSAPSSLC